MVYPRVLVISLVSTIKCNAFMPDRGGQFREDSPHNFVVEIFVAFGYVLGGLILAALAIYVIKAFIRAKDTEDRTFLVLLISCFMKLMLSGTYMEDYDIWILLGYCAGLLRRTRSVGDNVNMQSTAIGKNTRLEVVK